MPTQPRTRPSRQQDTDPPAGEEQTGEAAPDTGADVKKTRAKRQVRPKLPLYYESDDGILTPLGEYSANKPAEALDGYLNKLDDNDRAQALEAANYVVATAKGLVKLEVTSRSGWDIKTR